MTRPLRRRVRVLVLTAHVLAAVIWINGLVVLATLPAEPWTLDQWRWVHTLIWCVLVPSVAVVLMTGPVLARAWRYGWPRWLVAKTLITAAVVALGAVVLLTRLPGPAYYTASRWLGLAALALALVLSVLKPTGRRRIQERGKHAAA